MPYRASNTIPRRPGTILVSGRARRSSVNNSNNNNSIILTV